MCIPSNNVITGPNGGPGIQPLAPGMPGSPTTAADLSLGDGLAQRAKLALITRKANIEKAIKDAGG